MKKWIVEDWAFEVEVTRGEARSCRLGLEKGDSFRFEYETPGGFCPRAMAEIYTWCEVIRCGGNFTLRGSKDPYEMMVPCPCHCLDFRLKAIPINREPESGNDQNA